MRDVPPQRNKIPYWAMPVLAGLPLWAYAYQATLEPAPSGGLSALEAGAATYISSACANCHLGSGEGSVTAPELSGVLEDWPDVRDQMMWVRLGNDGWFETSGVEEYGANDTPSNKGVMPPHPLLYDAELAQVVLYERVQFGGMEEAGEEYEMLLAIAEGEMSFADAGLGTLSTEIGVDEANLAAG